MSPKPTSPSAVAKQEDGHGSAPTGKAKGGTKAAAKAPPAEKALSHAEIKSVLAGIMLAMFLGALDQTIVATALPTIGRAFGDVENLSWVVTAYLLSATAVTPLYGKLSDIYGRRGLMIVGVAIFVAGSIACALAPTIMFLIFARGLQGLGGGGLVSLAQTILADMVTPRERGRYQGYFGAVFATASIGGPVLGGFLSQHLDWSFIFWINLPLGAAALVMCSRALRKLPRHERRHSLDFLGSGLMVIASVALLLALNWGGIEYPWISAPIGALVLGSIVFWALFAWRLTTAPEPFIPLTILGNPIVRCTTLAGACGMGTLVGLTIFVPLYFEVVHHFSASQSGLALIPLMSSVVAVATVTGRALVHVENYKRMPLVGLTGSTLSVLALAIWPTGMPIALILVLLTIVGGGLGALFPVSTVGLQNAVSRQQMGTATGALNFFRSLGSALIVAIFGAIVLGGVGGRTGVSVEMLARTASGADLASAFRFVFLAAALILGFALAFVVALEQKPLRGPAAKEQSVPSDATTPLTAAE